MTESTTPASPSSWQVTSQTETTELGTGNNFVNGWRVYFTTGAGHEGSVFIPKLNYSPSFVRQAIAEAAANIDAVGSLRSGQ